MKREAVESFVCGTLAVVAFLLAAVLLAWLPLWQVPVYGYATWWLGGMSLMALFFIAMSTGPNPFLGATLVGIVFNIVLVCTGVWVNNEDAALRLQNNTLVPLPAPDPKLTANGHLYPGWWHDDVVVARHVRGSIKLETTLPQAGELNTLKLESNYQWAPEVYTADMLRNGAADYQVLTGRALQDSIGEVLSRYNENRPFREDELHAIKNEIGTVFCNRIAASRIDGAPCPTLDITLTYTRGMQVTTLKPR